MAYCKNCGAQIHDQAVICPQCGVEQRPMGSANDTGNIGWGLLGCCIPVVGLILYLVWKDSKPKTAKKVEAPKEAPKQEAPKAERRADNKRGGDRIHTEDNREDAGYNGGEGHDHRYDGRRSQRYSCAQGSKL